MASAKNIGSCQVSINRFILLAKSKHTHKCTLVSIGWWPVYCTGILCLVSNLTNLQVATSAFQLFGFDDLKYFFNLRYLKTRKRGQNKHEHCQFGSCCTCSLSLCLCISFTFFFFSPVNSSFVTLFVQTRSIYRLKRHLLLLFSIPFSSYLYPYLLLYFLFFSFRILVRHFILSICAQFCIVSALDIVYTCHRSMFCFSSFYFFVEHFRECWTF